MNEPVKILWTGGWDSTFRLLDLVLNKRLEVQPYYVLDVERKSTQTEIDTISKIKDEVDKLDSKARQLIKDHIMINKNEIPKNESITNQYKMLKDYAFMGGQYEWLGRLAYYYNLYRLELCVHKDDKAEVFLRGNVIKKSKENDFVYVLKDYDDENPLNLFTYYDFPLLDFTKIDMANQANIGGFRHIMELTWFCFNPTKQGEPCGLCNPCKYTREEGLGRRVPKPKMTTIIRSYFIKLVGKCKSIIKKVFVKQ